MSDRTARRIRRQAREESPLSPLASRSEERDLARELLIEEAPDIELEAGSSSSSENNEPDPSSSPQDPEEVNEPTMAPTTTTSSNVIYGQPVQSKVRGETLTIIAMGNNGKDPTTIDAFSSRPNDRRQFRLSGEHLDVKDYRIEPLDTEDRYEREGNVPFREFWENIWHECIRFGYDHVFWVRQTDEHGTVTHLHVLRDVEQITMQMVNDHIKHVKTCSYSYKDQMDAGQYFIKSMGTTIRKEVKEGGTIRIEGILVLYRLARKHHQRLTELVAAAKEAQQATSITDSPTMNLETFVTKTRENFAELMIEDPDKFTEHHMSDQCGHGLYGNDDYFESHYPPPIKAIVLEVSQKFTDDVCDWATVDEEFERVLTKYRSLRRKKAWTPAKNAPKSKEVAMIASLKGEVKSLTKQVALLQAGGSTSGTEMSSDGKVVLEAKIYPRDVWWNNFTQADRDKVNAMRAAKSSSGGGGGGGGNRTNNNNNPNNSNGGGNGGGIVNPFATPTAEEKEQGYRLARDKSGTVLKDKNGNHLKEWWCSHCPGKNDGETGRFTKTHGDKHERKHDNNFKAKQKEKSQAGRQSNGSLNLALHTATPPAPAPAPVPKQDEEPIAEVAETSYMFGYPVSGLHNAVQSYDAAMGQESEEEEESQHPKERGSRK